MLHRAYDFWIRSEPLRRRFGTVAGLRMSYQRRRDWLLAPGTVYEIKVPGIKTPIAVRAGTSDHDVFNQIFLSDEGQIPVNGTPMWMIDAGANIGLAAIAFLARFPAANVVAIEPDTENFSILQRNLRSYPNARCLRGALWHRSGLISIANPDDAKWAIQVAESGSLDVPAYTVAEVLRKFAITKIDLFKIDIEGAELEVFSGDTSWLNAVTTLAIETHDRFRPGSKDAVRQAVSARSHKKQHCGEYEVFHFT